MCENKRVHEMKRVCVVVRTNHHDIMKVITEITSDNCYRERKTQLRRTDEQL